MLCPRKTKNLAATQVVTCSMRYFPRKPVAAPILCGLDPPISGIFGDCRGEIAQDRDRHGLPTNARVQQGFIYFNYRPVSASFSGAYQVESFLVEGCEIICSNLENWLRLRRELVITGSQFFVDNFSWA